MKIFCGYYNQSLQNLNDGLPPYKQIENFVSKLKTVNEFYTNSPYVLNYLNLYIKESPPETWDKIEVYYIEEDGTLVDLKAKNINLINTNIHSEPINWIYNQIEQYDRIRKISR